MMVLALSGTAVPSLVNNGGGQAAQVALAPAAVAGAADALATATSATSSVVGHLSAPTQAGTTATTGAETAPAAVTPAEDPTYHDVQDGSRQKLLFSGNDSGSPNRPGGSRQSIIHRPGGSEDGGLLADTPIGAALDSALSAVSQAVPLPVDLAVSVPGVTGPLEAPLSVTAQLPAGQSVAVQVPPALSGVLGSVLAPVTGVLSGLTAKP
jgi:hypothetical protein